jgi:hypothetical protein
MRGTDLLSRLNSDIPLTVPDPIRGCLWTDIKETVIAILFRYTERIGHVMKEEGDLMKGLHMFCELRVVYAELIKTGFPEYRAQLEDIDAGLDRVLRAGRKQLLGMYLRSSDPEKMAEITETLQLCIAADPEWDWQAEYDRVIEERATELQSQRAC